MNVEAFSKFLSVALIVHHHAPSLSAVSASNILIFHTMATASHRTSIWPLVERLGDAGHNITYVFPIPRLIGTHPQVTELKPSKMFAAASHFLGDFDINIRLNNTVDAWLQSAFEKGVEFCEAFYDSPEIHDWLATPNLKYDLVMIDGAWGACAYGLVHKFKAKHIIFTPATLPYFWDPFGIVPESSAVPEIMFHRKPDQLQKSLWSGTVNTLATLVWRGAYLYSIRQMEGFARKYLNLSDMPSFEEIEQETSLVLHSASFIEECPMSLPPMYVSFSGMLCTEKDGKGTKQLDDSLEAFISEKESDGFVYVSFGSAVVVSDMPDTLRNEFFGAFRKFPRLRFLFKWDGPVPANAPKNVWFQKWFPQKDVLAHPRIKAFISQTGRPSTQEALCFAVPMIAIPIFGDQDMNADRLEQIEAGISVDITTLTSDMLENVIRKVVETDTYKSRMMELSAMFKDRPLDPVENVFYWVEYVLKHDTSLLKPLGRHQTWWQRRLLDVYAFLLAIVLGIIMLVVIAAALLFRFVMRMFWITTSKIGESEKIKFD